MNLRWLWFDYVDPALRLTRQQRRDVRHRAYVMMMEAPWRRRDRQLVESTAALMGSRGYRWAQYIAPIVPGAAMLLVFGANFLYFPRSIWGLVLLPPLQVGLTCLMFALVGRITWRPCVHRALLDLGYDVCIHCGYWLRGLSDDVKSCPECGAAREPMPP